MKLRNSYEKPKRCNGYHASRRGALADDQSGNSSATSPFSVMRRFRLRGGLQVVAPFSLPHAFQPMQHLCIWISLHFYTTRLAHHATSQFSPCHVQHPIMIRPMAKCRTSEKNVPGKSWVLTERRHCDLNLAGESAEAALYSQHLTEFHLPNDSVSSLTQPNGKDTHEYDFRLRLFCYKFKCIPAKKTNYFWSSTTPPIL